ncbi:DUF4157 domain-containing protein [Streptomyces sp. NPDC094049]|uniref:eCIS core domain-containing protein n=1 Tax=Streptomyces sp. NPDC094049 TaxID=3154987 RepID=UPI0033215674
MTEHEYHKDQQTRRKSPAPAGSAHTNPAGLLALQRTAGNAAVLRMLQRSGHPYAQPPVQREDRTAGRHVHDGGCGHQRAAPEQRPAVQRSAVHDVLAGTGRPLDAPLREEMEARLGADFSDVRIHDNTAARASATEIGARAYTSGTNIVIGDGGSDNHTLAHELTHVIQQRQGPVAGTDNGAGLSVSDPGDHFEREAEANAARVMRGAAPAAGAVQRATAPGHAAPAGTTTDVQRVSSGPSMDDEYNPTALEKRRKEQKKKEEDEEMMSDEMDERVPNERLVEDYETDSDDSEDEYVRSNSMGDFESQPTDPTWAAGAENRDIYNGMTQLGELWPRARSAARDGDLEGRDLVARMSEMNTFSMNQKIDKYSSLNEEREDPGMDIGDIEAFREKMEKAIGACVLRHYTDSGSIERILSSGGLLSDRTLQERAQQEGDTGRRSNTSPLDLSEIANDGFVFFFIEQESAGFRSTRFAGDNPARITVPIQKLTESGWIMLHDFNGMEFLTLRTGQDQGLLAHQRDDVHGNFSPEGAANEIPQRIMQSRSGLEEYGNRLASQPRENLEQQQILHGKWQRAVLTQQSYEGGLFAEHQRLINQSQAYNLTVRDFDHGDFESGKGTSRYYRDAALQEYSAYKERLQGNMLAGADIIPGLAARCTLELLRMSEGNGAAVARAMFQQAPEEILDHLFRSFLRPQAMLPGSVAVTRNQVEYSRSA